MFKLIKLLFLLGVFAAIAAAVPAFAPSLIWTAPELPAHMPTANAKRGMYVFRTAGCTSCHTAPAKGSKPLAGGLRIKTKYGVFVVPNITPDKNTGIGKWTETDFIRAMTVGLSPDGRHYYPAFPYTSYTRMTLLDLRDMWAYLQTVKPVRNTAALHQLKFPYDLRPGVGVWKVFFFSPGRYRPDKKKSRLWNRGAYLVTGPAHCGECHTPRNFAGARDDSRAMAGNPEGADGEVPPNITPHKKDGIGDWSKDDITDMLESGMVPSGDVVGGAMAHVVEKATGKLTAKDRAAIAVYLQSLKPIAGKPQKAKAAKKSQESQKPKSN